MDASAIKFRGVQRIIAIFACPILAIGSVACGVAGAYPWTMVGLMVVLSAYLARYHWRRSLGLPTMFMNLFPDQDLVEGATHRGDWAGIGWLISLIAMLIAPVLK
jgi:hypothetical protein